MSRLPCGCEIIIPWRAAISSSVMEWSFLVRTSQTKSRTISRPHIGSKMHSYGCSISAPLPNPKWASVVVGCGSNTKPLKSNWLFSNRLTLLNNCCLCAKTPHTIKSRCFCLSHLIWTPRHGFPFAKRQKWSCLSLNSTGSYKMCPINSSKTSASRVCCLEMG